MKIEVGSVGIQGLPYLIIVSAWDQHELVGDRIFLDDIAFEILRPDQCGGSSLKRYAHDGYCFFLVIDNKSARGMCFCGCPSRSNTNILEARISIR